MGAKGVFFERHRAWQFQVATTLKGSGLLWDCCPRDFPGLLLDMPLGTRAWAVQECVLPRRTLYFTRTRDYWECDSLLACERFPDGLSDLLSWKIYLKKRPASLEIWPSIAEAYSKCDLTLEDKLVAISGLAQLIHKAAKAEYAAGLWIENLEHKLCWHCPESRSDFRPSKLRSIRSVYRAPSWSWASVDRRILYPKPKHKPPHFYISVDLHKYRPSADRRFASSQCFWRSRQCRLEAPL
jgi:hypothetical protein